MSTNYGFDELYIGEIDSESKALKTRDVRRPYDLASHDWYDFAAAVCALLNKEHPCSPSS